MYKIYGPPKGSKLNPHDISIQRSAPSLTVATVERTALCRQILAIQTRIMERRRTRFAANQTATFRAGEAPADVDVRMMLADGPEVLAAHDVEAGQLHGAGCQAEVAHVIGGRTARTAVHAT